MQIDRPLRVGRAAVFAAACVGVSAAGHVWMSGASTPAFAVLAALLAVGPAGYALARRQRGFASIAGLMLAGELGLHLLFSWAQHATSTPTMPPMPGMTGMAVSGDPMPAVHGAAGMVAVHAAAGLVCAAWLHRGEVALFRLLRAVARFALAPLAVFAAWICAQVLPDPTNAVTRLDERREVGPRRHRWLAHALVRRGPPSPPVFSM